MLFFSLKLFVLKVRKYFQYTIKISFPKGKLAGGKWGEAPDCFATFDLEGGGKLWTLFNPFLKVIA